MNNQDDKSWFDRHSGLYIVLVLVVFAVLSFYFGGSDHIIPNGY